MPGWHIDNLKSNIGSYARGYLFNMIFTSTPVDLAGGENKSTYLVRSTTMPDKTIEVIEVPWQGQMQKIASTNTFAEWEVTFNVDGDGFIKKQIDAWSKKVHDPSTNNHGIPSDYYGIAQVELLNTQGNPIVTYEIRDMWPSTVGALDLAQDTKDVSQLTVTFTYNYHIPL